MPDLSSNIKLSIKVELIGELAIKITFIKAHNKLIDYYNDIIFYSYKNFFSIKKGLWPVFTPNAFIFPKKPEGNNVCSYVFRNEKERYKTLLKFSKTLKELSLSSHFYYENINFKDNTLLYYKNNWTLY